MGSGGGVPAYNVSGDLSGVLANASSNLTNNATTLPPFALSDSRIAYITIPIGIIVIGTILANSLVILSVLLVKKLQTPSNILVVSLACADMLVGLFVMPIAAVTEIYEGQFVLGFVMCDIFVMFDMLLCTASILNLCAISVDRYLVITRPFIYIQKRTPRLMAVYIAVVWLMSVAISLPAQLGWKKDKKPGDGDEKVCSYPDDLLFQLYATMVAFYFPTAGMLYVNFQIMRIVGRIVKQEAKSGGQRRQSQGTALSYQSARRTSDLSGGSSSGGAEAAERRGSRLARIFRRKSKKDKDEKDENKEQKGVRTLGVIVGTFLVCWLPFFTMQLVNAIRHCSESCFGSEGQHMWFFSVLLWLGYAKSFVNPLIYVRFTRDFWRPFQELLMCRCVGLENRLRSEAYREQYGAQSQRRGALPPRSESMAGAGPIMQVFEYSRGVRRVVTRPQPDGRPGGPAARDNAVGGRNSVSTNKTTDTLLPADKQRLAGTRSSDELRVTGTPRAPHQSLLQHSRSFGDHLNDITFMDEFDTDSEDSQPPSYYASRVSLPANGSCPR